MALSMKSVCSVKSSAVSVRSTVRPARTSALVVRASQDAVDTSRRVIFTAAAAAVIGAAAGLTVVGEAQANGAAKNGSSASQSSYDMEGTKKLGVSAGKRAKLLAAVKAKAVAATS